MLLCPHAKASDLHRDMGHTWITAALGQQEGSETARQSREWPLRGPGPTQLSDPFLRRCSAAAVKETESLGLPCSLEGGLTISPSSWGEWTPQPHLGLWRNCLHQVGCGCVCEDLDY